MSMWAWWPGKWLGRLLEQRAVLARTRLPYFHDQPATGAALRFPIGLLEAVFPNQSWWEEPGCRRPIRLRLESHGEDHDAVVLERNPADRGDGVFRIAGFRTNDTVLSDRRVSGELIVLGFLPHGPEDPLRGHLWLARDETEGADIEEAFDIHWDHCWGRFHPEALLREDYPVS